MRVFRKRQLRLREGNNDTLHIFGNNMNDSAISGSMKSAQDVASGTGRSVEVKFPSNSSNSKGTVVPNSNTNNIGALLPQIKKYGNDNYDCNLTTTPDGRFSGNGNSDTNESRFSGNLIEGAVMFSKKELRDFLRKL